MSGRLEGRVAVVTGAGGAGCGGAICRRLARDGAPIAAIESHERRAHATAQALADEFGVPTLAVPLDIADRAGVDAATERIDKELGPIDILINNAAINVQGSIFDYDPDTFDQVLEVDLTACWYLIRGVIGGMRDRRRGAIVNISSVAAYNGGRGREAPYSAAKAGLNEITRGVAIEGGPFGIRCNAVAPGLIMSKFAEKHWERLKVELDNTPLRRFAEPDEIANVVAFLCSDEASYVTGEVITMTGGWYLRA